MAKPSSGQLKEFWSQVEDGRINSANFQEFLTSPESRKQGEEAELTFKVNVDYSQSLSVMIEAGKFDRVSEACTSKNFPVEGEGQVDVDVVIVHLDRHATTTGEVEAELDKRGLRPARIEELLALGTAYPDLQREYPIVALGSGCVLGVDGIVPVLFRDVDRRELSLDYYEDEWERHCRFAAVRK